VGLTALRLPQSFGARTLAFLVVGFGLLFVAMVAVHDVLLRRAADRATEEFLAQRLATLFDVVAVLPAAERARVAEAMSGPETVLRWQREPFEGRWRPDGGGALPGAERRLAARPGRVADVRVKAMPAAGGDPDLRDVNAVARLADGSWVWVGLPAFRPLTAEQSAMHAWAAAIGLVLLVAVGWTARSLSAPVTGLAAAVARLDPEHDGGPVPERGPREVRALAAALNAMVARTRDAFRQRTLAIGALSHDLMSPIARLKLRADTLAEADAGAIRRDLAEMETMVDDVLAYLRGGREGERAEPVSVAALVRTVVSEHLEAGHAVEERGLDAAAEVEGRRVAIKRAVTNIVGNALRHGADPWVEVAAEPGAVVVRVGDRGPGIPAEDLPRVTEPFFRGDRARTAGGGLGLGLATARAVAEDHGGTLRIWSEPGRGTLVTLRLPRRPAAAAPAATATAPRARAAPA
jgi:signal transduction histidine kinase